MVCNVSEGVCWDNSLCRSCDGVKDLQEVDTSNSCVKIFTTFGKNTLDLSSAFFFFRPKSPSWSKFTAMFR